MKITEVIIGMVMMMIDIDLKTSVSKKGKSIIAGSQWFVIFVSCFYLFVKNSIPCENIA